MLCDYHVHSRYSYDGREAVEDIAEAAVGRGITELCLTDHVDILARPEEGREGLRAHLLAGGPEFSALKRDVEAAREKYEGRLKLRLGMELGQPQAHPDTTRELMEIVHPDFIIGSVHNMKNDEDLYYYDFAKLDREAFFHEYLDMEIELARDYDYDVIGHCTYPLRYLVERGFSLDLAPFMEQLRELFRIVIQRGRGIEFNVSGLVREVRVLLPDLSLIREYLSMGGEILTIGSDAHVLSHVGTPIREGMELLKQAGVKAVCTYENRQPVFHPLD